MLVKLNSKPITVLDEDKEEKAFDPVYLCVSCLCYGLILLLMDYVCYTFFGTSPFPFLSWIWRWFV